MDGAPSSFVERAVNEVTARCSRHACLSYFSLFILLLLILLVLHFCLLLIPHLVLRASHISNRVAQGSQWLPGVATAEKRANFLRISR